MNRYNIVVLGTGNVVLEMIRLFQRREEILIRGVILDESSDVDVKERFKKDIGHLELECIQFEDLDTIQFDMVFTCEYRKIIPAHLVNKYLFINVHAGVLPKYRGSNANAWAIINGEKEIGYSIHQMNADIDAGKLFYVYKQHIDENQTYGDVHDELIRHMITMMPVNIIKILNGELKGEEQEEKYILCEHFRKSDGIIRDYNICSQYLYNLYRCFAKPLGTGIYFIYKKKHYEVGKVIMGIHYGVQDYVGFPGRIVNINKKEIWIKTKDNIICFGDLKEQNGKDADMSVFVIGSSLS